MRARIRTGSAMLGSSATLMEFASRRMEAQSIINNKKENAMITTKVS